MVFMPELKVPTSAPIKSFKDLLDWKPGQDEYNVAHTPFHPRPIPIARRAGKGSPVLSGGKTPGSKLRGLRDCKVICCHDMAGGYAEDAHPQGNDYSHIYSIQYWNHIDIFIYFSHYRITIPPPVWTNAAHKNGVRSIGTLITEWLPGVIETDEMVSGPDQPLSDEDGNDTVDRRWFSKTYADKLVDVAVYYKFDGWFINIESIMRGGVQQVNQTIAFLRYLREQIHQRIPGGELHWYDSVITSTGEVAWQDKLSPENYSFFEQCDGIFTNYTWKENAVGESVVLAGPRNRDVFTGIDIWGRNTFGGGGFTTYKALEIIQRERTSCALFAPAWTYESLGKEGFMTNDRLFWAGYNGAGFHAENLPLSSFYLTTCWMLATKPKKSGREKLSDGDGDKDKDEEDNRNFQPISTYIPLRPSGCPTWFYSNFDRGFGKSFWINGKKVSDKSWSHLSHQSLSPSLSKDIFSTNRGHTGIPLPGIPKAVRWILSPEEAYNGGTCLIVQEFSLDSSTPPLPPLPIPPPSLPVSLPQYNESALTNNSDITSWETVDRNHITRTRSIIVPLFDTQISLSNAIDSTVELIFKSCLSDVQVGVHLGMMVSEQDKDDDDKIVAFARNLAKNEILELLEPSIKEQLGNASSPTHTSSINLPSSVTKSGFLSFGAAEEASSSGNLETVLTLDIHPQESGFANVTEILEGGWRRFTLHISSLFANNGGEKGRDLSTIYLSQLGLTLTYDGETAPSKAPEKEEFRPLVIVGSLAVVPTWSAAYKGSCVLGLKTDASQFVVVERNTPNSIVTLEQPEQQYTLGDYTVQQQSVLHPLVAVLKISSKLTWNVGYLINGPTLDIFHKSPSSLGEVSSIDYSHYAVYVSLEPRDLDRNSVQQSSDDDRILIFVGTAFTNQYQISQLEIPLDQIIPSSLHHLPETTTTVSNVDTEQQEDFSVQRLMTNSELINQDRRAIWVWVQGIRRDGRADGQHDWAVERLF
ncbi:hypothetical protein FBU30_002042 [Linnemannia zychae]|nr:hypothetical protein FBU30_002042 [Linnemannia zychae]